MTDFAISLVGVTLFLALVVGPPVLVAAGIQHLQYLRAVRARRAALRRARFTRWTRAGGAA